MLEITAVTPSAVWHFVASAGLPQTQLHAVLPQRPRYLSREHPGTELSEFLKLPLREWGISFERWVEHCVLSK